MIVLQVQEQSRAAASHSVGRCAARGSRLLPSPAHRWLGRHRPGQNRTGPWRGSSWRLLASLLQSRRPVEHVESSVMPRSVPADNNTISELSSLHEEDGNFRQSYHQMRSKQLPGSRDLESSTDYWSGVVGGSSGASRGPSAVEYSREDRDGFRHRCRAHARRGSSGLA